MRLLMTFFTFSHAGASKSQRKVTRKAAINTHSRDVSADARITSLLTRIFLRSHGALVADGLTKGRGTHCLMPLAAVCARGRKNEKLNIINHVCLVVDVSAYLCWNKQ
jgi:hypothetical protein